MKKYVKPELFYERYELSQHIADCTWETKKPNGLKTFEGDGSCIAYGDSELGLDGNILFQSNEMGCTLLSTDYQDYCYENGSDGLKTVMS